MSRWINRESIKCHKCGGSETYIRPDGTHIWHVGNKVVNIKSYICHECWKEKQRSDTQRIKKEQDNSKKCVICGINGVYAKRMCEICYKNDYYLNTQKLDHRYGHMANSRTGNLARYSLQGKAVIGQWIGAKTLDIKDLNIENNNFAEHIDLSYHNIYGDMAVKTKTLRYGEWKVGNVKNLNFDNLLTLCMDKYSHWKNVERAYVIQVHELRSRSGFAIVKDSSRCPGWYEKYRVDEKPYDDTYNSVDIPRFFSPFDLWKGKYDKIH